MSLENGQFEQNLAAWEKGMTILVTLSRDLYNKVDSHKNTVAIITSSVGSSCHLLIYAKVVNVIVACRASGDAELDANVPDVGFGRKSHQLVITCQVFGGRHECTAMNMTVLECDWVEGDTVTPQYWDESPSCITKQIPRCLYYTAQIIDLQLQLLDIAEWHNPG